jgi:hypothetical protein
VKAPALVTMCSKCAPETSQVQGVRVSSGAAGLAGDESISVSGTSFCGNSLVSPLLADAVRRVIGAARSLAVFAIVVEATDEKAAAFYRDFGFAPFARCGCFSKMQKVLRAVTQVGRFGQYAPKYLCTRTSGTIASAAPTA